MRIFSDDPLYSTHPKAIIIDDTRNSNSNGTVVFAVLFRVGSGILDTKCSRLLIALIVSIASVVSIITNSLSGYRRIYRLYVTRSQFDELIVAKLISLQPD